MKVGDRERHGIWTPRPRVIGPLIGLVLVAALAAGFGVLVVQMQAAATAYASGNSIWSRAQLATVESLRRYAETGEQEALERGRYWLRIPLGDLEARRAMEAPALDYEAAYEGLLQGQNHPDDIPRMIWLFRFLSDAPYFRQAVDAWRRSDPCILELQTVADELEAARSGEPPSPERIAALQERLRDINSALEPLSEEFRHAMAESARWMTWALSVASAVFILILAVSGWLLAWRLFRTVTAAERSFYLTFEQAPVGIARVDSAGRLLDANPALYRILRYPVTRLLGTLYSDLVHPEDRDLALTERRHAGGGAAEVCTVEKRLLCGDGGTAWCRVTVSTAHDESAVHPQYIVLVEDVSEARRLTAELDFQANHDTLTGLLNRRAFERSLTELLDHARIEPTQHAVCLVDLDQFKVVNDTSGHSAGDALVRQVGAMIRRHVREGDVVARLGGDEFAVILANCDADNARSVAEKLRQLVAGASFMCEGSRYRSSCSIGVVPTGRVVTDTASMMRTVDIACYMAKEQGRNRVYVLYEDDEEVVQRHGEMAWLARIRTALQEGRMFLDAQRIVHLQEPEQLRYELLVRLRDEHGSVIPPGAFLPAAERFGAAHEIDRWVIEQACQTLAAHPDHLALVEACHINLSGQSFDQDDFRGFVQDTIRRYRVPPEKLCFEITETAAASNIHDVTAFMEALRREGCGFALDDFGAGMSSFGYLRRLPVDCLKIDGLFVRDIATDDTDLALVRAINEIGQTLGKTVVAESVETEEVMDVLRGMGVQYAQGYGAHRPCRFEDLIGETSPRKRRRSG